MPLAAFFAMSAAAVNGGTSAAALETRFLAVIAAGVLAAAAALRPRPGAAFFVGAALVVAALWTLPADSGRGAVVVTLALAALGFAAAERLRESSAAFAAADPAVTVPLAVGAQLVCRGGLLVEGGIAARDLAILLALPLVAALATSALARRRGVGALLAAAAVLAVGGGFRPAGVGALVALAAGEEAARARSRGARLLALAVVLAPVAWQPQTGLLAAGAGMAVAFRGWSGFAAALVAATCSAVWRAGAIPVTNFEGLIWLALVVPTLAPAARSGLPQLAAAVALASAAGAGPSPPALPSLLAAAVALAALSVPRESGAQHVQAAWSAAITISTALFAAYPWLRGQPLAAALGLAGVPRPWLAVTALIAGTLLPRAAHRLATRLHGWRTAAWAAGLALVALTALVLRPDGATWAAGKTLVPPEGWEHTFDGVEVGAVRLVTSLANAGALPRGAPVARLRARTADGAELEVRLDNGRDTGEWAAARPDVGGTAAAPEAWRSWVADGFFGRSYRAEWRLDPPRRLIRLRLERDPGLAPEIELTLHHFELRRRRLGLATDDPLRTTLLSLPFVAAAFAALHAAARRRGASRIPPAAPAGELAASAVLVLVASARQALGLPAEVVYAGFLLVLAHRGVRQLVALRPLLARARPLRPPLLFFLLPLVVYLALLPWSSERREPDGDEPYYLLITHSLAQDFDAELTDDYADREWRRFMSRPIEPQPGDPRGPHGEVFSRHNELLPLVLVPGYRVAGKAGALVTMAVIAAALAWMALRLMRRYFPERPGEALLAYGIFAFAPPLVFYSGQVWVEVPAALLAAVALDRLLVPGGWGWKKWLGVGLPLLLLPLLKLRLLMLAGPLLATAWLYAGRPRRPLLVLAGLFAVLGSGILVHNHFVYGNALKVHTLEEVEFYRQPLGNYLKGMSGFFWDCAFGLFAAAPIWLLLLPALGLLIVRRHALARHLAVFALPYLALVAPRGEWYGGWSPPFRYPLVTLPLIAVTLVPLLAGRRQAGARALATALATLTLVLALLFLAVPGWTYNFADGRTYLLDSLSERFGADVARLFASSLRPRAATWLWPLAGLAAIPLLWFFPRRRRRGAAAWGMAALLASTAALPLAASWLPSGVVEFEDPQVAKSGGHVEPPRWTFERTRFRGAWVLRGGESLRAPIAAGGDEVTMRLHTRFVRNHPGALELELRAGDEWLATVRLARPNRWEERQLGPYRWPRGAPLVLAVPSPQRPFPEPNGVLLDRVELDWR